jgi:hypothetical protein
VLYQVAMNCARQLHCPLPALPNSIPDMRCSFGAVVVPSIANQEKPLLIFVLFPFILEAVGNQFAGHSIIVDQKKVRACGVAAAA